MAQNDLTAAYREMTGDFFPSHMEISFYDATKKQTLVYEKVEWTIAGEKKGLRYGENPDQPAAFYKLLNGNLRLGEVENITPGNYLASDIALLQSGKHPGKTNITDIDNALNILRYLHDRPAVVIVKHNNPCGAAVDRHIRDAYEKALLADRIAAFGGAVACNRNVDKETAEHIASGYTEVIAAPDYEEGAFDILASRKNLRIMKIANIENLQNFIGKTVLDFKSLIDGGIITQWSYVPKTRSKADCLPARVSYKGKEYRVNREPTDAEFDDMLFGWLVESGITSNSVVYVKDGVTVGIGTGEQDRVGVAEIARDKAYRKCMERLAWQQHNCSFEQLDTDSKRKEIKQKTETINGGLQGSVMISDAFFPFRDGIDVGLREGVAAVMQPGGSLRDFECIEACNEYNAAMVFTGQRSFKH
jgi:phosphoribosylaminoimidazolecarboxamide formyltransferase / IMP cyclohydrolase